ncbi:MAG: dihydroorotase [Oscillospiraceae bacterium]
MRVILKNGLVFHEGKFSRMDISIKDGRVEALAPGIAFTEFDSVTDCSQYYIFPGLADVHVHLREPGFSYKETIDAGTAAAARGGYTALCAMPNLSPPPDTLKHLEEELKLIAAGARVAVRPFGCITRGGTGRGELAELEAMAPHVAGFSDDGKGVQEAETMRAAMTVAARLGKIIAAHCEDESLAKGGYVHDGEYARRRGHRGIPPESEWRQIERDIKLVRETGSSYHVCHVSTKEGVELVRRAKADGLPVSCETAPHYLLLCDEDLMDEGCFKMNPPIRGEADRQALLEGIMDGTIDMIATDHAPHSEAEKSRGLKDSLMGIVGLETALPVLFTRLVRPGIITIEKLVELMCLAPRRRFKLGGGEIKAGEYADLTVFDPTVRYVVDQSSFLSKGRSTPFEGWRVYGETVMTFYKGRLVWNREAPEVKNEQALQV